MSSDLLSIGEPARFDDSITKKEYHSYAPFVETFNNNDQIRITIQNQDQYLLPSESFLYIERRLEKTDKNEGAVAHLASNACQFLFEEIRYELNGIEIDRNRNVGITTCLKNYASLTPNQSVMAGWTFGQDHQEGHFNFCVPLNMLFGFCEDYKKVVANAKHELILIRSKSDENAIIANSSAIRIALGKIIWKMPHINLSDSEKLRLYKTIQSSRPIQMSFRSWELFEYPNVPKATHVFWSVKTSTQLEKPRFVLFGMQTGRSYQVNKDASKFDFCSLTNIKVYLNSETFPYDNLNLNFENGRYALLYDMYTRFQEAYYGSREDKQPLLNFAKFKTDSLIAVIDCSHQNESIRSGPVDVRLEFETDTAIPKQISAFCLILHDRLVEYTPLTGDVRKIV